MLDEDYYFNGNILIQFVESHKTAGFKNKYMASSKGNVVPELH
jgi:hypothetical protein